MKTEMKIGKKELEIELPEETVFFPMKTPQLIKSPEKAIEDALEESYSSLGLEAIVQNKLKNKPDADVCIVISDNTRPVPYKGKAGILLPVVKKVLAHIPPERVLIIVATGTHRGLSEKELAEMIDPELFKSGITIKSHDCRDRQNLSFLGKTKRGSEIYINSEYINADIKILTGLVESHFMAGVSGGRKSICPGLIGEESTYVFHGALMLAHPESQDLVLEGNPCHEEALEVAKKAGADYIINVTLDNSYRLTGVFAGDLEAAHRKAVEKIREYVEIPFKKKFDIVVTHAGFVGINHYQASKAATAALQLLKPEGSLIMAADNTDSDPVGSANYKTVMHLLKTAGAQRFNKLLLSPDWPFFPEQWGAQMWAKIFEKINPDNFSYYSPQLSKTDFDILPGIDGNLVFSKERRYRGTVNDIPEFIKKTLDKVINEYAIKGKTPGIAYLIDGPYGIPVRK